MRRPECCRLALQRTSLTSYEAGQGIQVDRAVFPNEAWSGWVWTLPTQVPANTTTIDPGIEIRTQLKGSAGSGILKISRPKLRKLAAAPV